MKLRRLVKGIKLNWMVFKGIINDSRNVNEFFTYDMVNEEGIIYDYSPATLAKFKIAVAGVQVVQFGLLNFKPRFIYDDVYLQMSKDAQEFIKQHELGHWTLHQNLLLSGMERDINLEFEADEYAASMVGTDTAIKGLEELHDVLATMNFDKKHENTDELEKRIENLKKLLVEVK